MIKFLLRNWRSSTRIYLYSQSAQKFNVEINYYTALNLNENSTPQQVKLQFYKLAKENHPDLNPQNDKKFKQINEAYQVLSKHKAEYDQARKEYQSGNYQPNQQQQYYEGSHQQYYSGYGSYESQKARAFRDDYAQFYKEQLRRRQEMREKEEEERRKYQEFMNRKRREYQEQVNRQRRMTQEQAAQQQSQNYTFGQHWSKYEQEARDFVHGKVYEREQRQAKQEEYEAYKEQEYIAKGYRDVFVSQRRQQEMRDAYEREQMQPKQRNIFEEYLNKKKGK